MNRGNGRKISRGVKDTETFSEYNVSDTVINLQYFCKYDKIGHSYLCQYKSVACRQTETFIPFSDVNRNNFCLGVLMLPCFAFSVIK